MIFSAKQVILHHEYLVNALWLALIGAVPLVQLSLRYRRKLRAGGKAATRQTLFVAGMLLGLFTVAIIAQLLAAFGVPEFGPLR